MEGETHQIRYWLNSSANSGRSVFGSDPVVPVESDEMATEGEGGDRKAERKSSTTLPSLPTDAQDDGTHIRFSEIVMGPLLGVSELGRTYMVGLEEEMNNSQRRSLTRSCCALNRECTGTPMSQS